MSIEKPGEENLFPITKKYLDKGLTLGQLFDLDVRPSQIQPILIDLIQGIVDKKGVIDLLRNYESDRFSEPSALSQREIIHLSDVIYQQVPHGYVDIELSPVAPLGANSILTEVSQRSVISTVRNVEVLADPTTMLALECAKRRRTLTKGSSSDNFIADLCTSVRCIRGQVFSKESGFIPHFQLFAMASGGISSGEVMNSKITEHLSTFLNFLTSIQGHNKAYSVSNVKVDVSDINIVESLIKSMGLNRRELGRHSQDGTFNFFASHGISLPSSISNLSELDDKELGRYGILKYIRSLQKISDSLLSLKDKYPNVSFNFDLARIAGIGYYNGPCFKVMASNSNNEEFPLADGGYSDWLAKLLSNKRISYFSSGFGLELFGNLFKA